MAFACASALLCAPGTARAADDDDATVTMARERFKEGVSYFDKKEFDRARAAFLQAYALKKHPAVLLNLAQSELRSGHEVDAATHFSQYLREAKDATDAEKQAAEAGLTAAKVVAIEATVSVDQAGAEILVDGKSVGSSPLAGPLYLSSGDHTLEARKEGKTATSDLSSSAGKSVTVELKFAAKPAPKKVVEPEAQPETEEPAPLPPTEQSHGGRKPFFKWLTHSPYGLAGMGLTTVGLGAGITGALVAKHNYDNANNVADLINSNAGTDWRGSGDVSTFGLCNNPSGWLQNTAHYNGAEPLPDRANEYQKACGVYQDDKSAGDHMKTVAIVGFAVSGAAAVGTVLMYFVDPRAKTDEAHNQQPAGPSIAVVPLLGPNERGLLMSGSF
jgi:hypothetical protein